MDNSYSNKSKRVQRALSRDEFDANQLVAGDLKVTQADAWHDTKCSHVITTIAGSTSTASPGGFSGNGRVNTSQPADDQTARPYRKAPRIFLILAPTRSQVRS